MYNFNQNDLQQLREHGITEGQVQDQLKSYQKGIPFVHLESAATVGNGIWRLDEKEKEYAVATYNLSAKSVLKFVPASGAATRMFKLLHQFLDEFDPKKNALAAFLKTEKFSKLRPFFEQMQKLPFYEIVRAERQTRQRAYTPSSVDDEKYEFVRYMLNEMQYENLPKGLIPFHHYPDKTATAFEEHLYEAAAYCKEKKKTRKGKKKCRLHFTVAEEHSERFKQTFEEIRDRVEAETDVVFEIVYSFQKKSTDTIAVDENNEPFRDEDGKLFFRPGGHGALIQNLNDVDADMVFIKNIDNVVTQTDLPTVTAYKKALAGILIEVQEKIFALLKSLDEFEFSSELKKQAEELAQNDFKQPEKFSSAREIRRFFNRPLRVCGMVKNEGEPGGGPFWVKNKNGARSLQIVEEAQIDRSDDSQKEILQNATHFNPVDLVCGIKTYEGEAFDLMEFVNRDEGFIADKTKNGKPLKALELPGLWNGAMAYWNTIFVEVPLKTFNPVKTVVDLLKDSHQG